jgi:DNA-binding response OmpR family regulator
MTILLIEDDVAICWPLAAGLRQLGFRVLRASNGLEAEGIYHSWPVDVVITDLFMPEKDGIETIINLGKEFPNLPVIAMAERRAGPFIVSAASLLGAKAVLEKPCSAADLAAAIRNLATAAA